MRSGGINLPASKPLFGSGRYGNYWSSAVLNEKTSYFLDLRASDLSPSHSDNYGRSVGRSLRCLAS